MLNVQKFLRDGGTLEQLSNDLGIKVTRHSSDPLVILNYDQIESPKSHPIVRECRALTLELDSWNIVGRAFSRFFNWGEMADEMPDFNWNDCFAQSKEDGSIMVLYNYNGTWRVNTRGSFGDGLCGFSEKSWTELFFETVNLEKVQEICEPGMSFVFEFCSLHNKVVRTYSTPEAFLLTFFDVTSSYEVSQNYSNTIAKQLGVSRPEVFDFKSIDEVIKYLQDRGQKDATFEGVVVCDNQKHRWKIKNPLYLSLHKMRGEGNNLFNPKYLLPYVLAGELSELLVYFPEVEEAVTKMKVEVDSAYINLMETWETCKDIAPQKEFAQAIIPRTKFANLLFQARKQERSIVDLWRESGDLILKVLYNK